MLCNKNRSTSSCRNAESRVLDRLTLDKWTKLCPHLLSLSDFTEFAVFSLVYRYDNTRWLAVGITCVKWTTLPPVSAGRRRARRGATPDWLGNPRAQAAASRPQCTPVVVALPSHTALYISHTAVLIKVARPPELPALPIYRGHNFVMGFVRFKDVILYPDRAPRGAMVRVPVSTPVMDMNTNIYVRFSGAVITS